MLKLLVIFLLHFVALPERVISREIHKRSNIQTSYGTSSSSVLLQKEKEDEEGEEEKRPYRFAWAASRHYNGAPDREHTEERGKDGITRGVFRFVDPRQQIQEVVYLVDDSGFHAQASHLPQQPRDTPVVAAARKKHGELFERIRAQHEALALELKEKAIRAKEEAEIEKRRMEEEEARLRQEEEELEHKRLLEEKKREEEERIREENETKEILNQF